MPATTRSSVVALVAIAALAGCSSRIEERASVEFEPVYLDTEGQMPMIGMANGSIYAPNQSGIVSGSQRARQVGDILTVNIDIDDRAQTSNSTQRTRSNEISSGVSNFFGLENSLGRAFPGGFDPSTMVGMEGGSSSNGSGTIISAVTGWRM